MPYYNCKVHIFNEKEIRVYAENKNEAAEIAADACTHGFGINISHESRCVKVVKEKRTDGEQERDL